MSDADRFSAVLSQVAGKRLTFADVTGKWEKRSIKHRGWKKRGRKARV